LAIFAAILRPLEGYLVTHPKILVYFKPGVSQLQIQHADKLFGLDSYIQTLKNHIWPVGDGKFTLRLMRIFQHKEGKFICRIDRECEFEFWDCCGYVRVSRTCCLFALQILVSRNKICNSKFTYLCI